MEHREAQIISAIENAAEVTGLAHSTISERGAGNSRLYKRLKEGGEKASCSPEVADRLLNYIDGLIAPEEGAA
jgi:hypothetical protein